MKVFDAVNIFDDSNKQLRACFLFFFFTAICGYASIILLFFPHNDDSVRYIVNSSVGAIDAAGYLPNILEIPLYLSSIVTDIAPFTRIISCFFLAYIATICLRLFKIDLNNRWQVLCMLPVVVNPYMLEIMLYKFDNPFMTLALLMVIAAAYVMAFQGSSVIIIATLLLLASMFTYQAAINGYLIVLAYFLINEMSAGRTSLQSFHKMRRWFGVLSATICLYLPFTALISYGRGKDGSLLVIPTNLAKLKIIIDNINDYFSSCYADWSANAAGTVIFALFFCFFLSKIAQTISNRRSLLSFATVLIALFTFALCPLGVCVFINSVVNNFSKLVVRVLYSSGLLLSIILLDNQKLFNKLKSAKFFFNCILVCLSLWLIFFLNSAGNIIYRYRLLEDQVSYDIAKDADEIINSNAKISRLCVIGSISTPAMTNFWKLYPIMNKIIPEKSHGADHSRLVLFNSKLIKMETYSSDAVLLNNLSEMKRIKSHMWYDMFVVDHKMLLVRLKEGADLNSRHLYVRVRDEK